MKGLFKPQNWLEIKNHLNIPNGLSCEDFNVFKLFPTCAILSDLLVVAMQYRDLLDFVSG